MLGVGLFKDEIIEGVINILQISSMKSLARQARLVWNHFFCL